MFIILLKFSDNKSDASTYMADHNAWLKQGFDDGVFMVAGSLQPGLGGAILANGVSNENLAQRIRQDPFVEHGVVEPEVLEISPAKANQQLAFLLDQ